MKLPKIAIALLFLIISMGFVSAQDDLNCTLETVQTDIQTTDDAGSFIDLQNDLNSAGNMLNITKNYKNDLDERVNISRDNFVINGNGHTIDGDGHKIFLIEGSNITINNLILANGCCSYGGGGAIYNRGAVSLNNVTFINNYAAGGGAIFNWCGFMELCDVVFVDNSALEDSAAITNGGSGIMYLTNATFVNNSAPRGGAILNDGDFMGLWGAVFIGNSADEDGGAICNLNKTLYLYDVTFVNNSANNGAAIHNFGNMGLEGAVFADNSADYGAAIFNRGTMELYDAAFINNNVDKNGGAIYCDNATFDLCNATFINNSAEVDGGAVYCFDSAVDLCNATFINNSVEVDGGAIYSWNGFMELCDATFVNNSAKKFGGAIVSNCKLICKESKFTDGVAKFGNELCLAVFSQSSVYGCCFESTFPRNYGAIWALNATLYVNGSVFANFTTNYAPAIYSEEGNLTINNTRFVNLHACRSAGALSVKGFYNFVVENSGFINASSIKNGGAIFADSSTVYCEKDNKANIHNVSFINDSGDFGGAYVQLGGKLNMSDSAFINCTSKYDGGAVYLSMVTAEIINASFISNKITSYDDYPTFGGAIYLDNGVLTIQGSRFADNSAFEGSGVICSYDSIYHIINSTFDDDGEAIHAIFKNDESEIIDFYGNDTISDENVFYPYVISAQGRNLTLITNEINLDTLPIRFDLRDYGWVSPVKSQGIMGSCWAFASVSSLESELLRSSGLSLNISENNMQNMMLFFSKYGAYTQEGGTCLIAAGYLVSWLGAIAEECDEYDEMGKISPVILTSDNIHIQDFGMVYRNLESNDTSSIKQAILKHGVVSCNLAAAAVQGDDYGFYDSENHTQYTPYVSDGNHEVCIVGWDDTFSRDKFVVTPPDDGAWICKNSWGTDWGDEGYFYVSYYDKTLSTCEFTSCCSLFFLFENTVPYHKNYQYDFAGLADFYTLEDGGNITYANKFTAIDDDLIAGIGTYFNQSGMNYSIAIEVNGKIVLLQSGVSPYRGYHTVKLDNYVSIKKGDEFRVYVTSNAMPLSGYGRIYYDENVSMSDYWGNWTDVNAMVGVTACIKAYTVCDDSRIIGNGNVSVDYGSDSYFHVRVVTADGHAVVGAPVNFTIGGKTVVATTDAGGVAEIKITEAPNTYLITTSFNGIAYNNTVVVRPASTDDDVPVADKIVLTASKITVKKTAAKFTLKSKLKINGKPVKGKKITFKFKGKTYKAKTNSKGIAKVTVKRNVIKKLKKGKTYTVKVTYLKDTIKSSVKVR